MSQRRITIYDLARAMGISASYVSRALNEHPSINPEVVAAVKKKAKELNFKLNSHAANLRQGSSKTLGVIVPHINQSFFSEIIAGIEEICFEHNHSLIICQTHESFQRECLAVDTLVRQNVDCIILSVAAETTTTEHLESIAQHNIPLIQIDRYLDQLNSCKVLNDNKKAAYDVMQSLFGQGYERIAFLGGPTHLTTFKQRRDGFLQAWEDSAFSNRTPLLFDDVFDLSVVTKVIDQLLQNENRPDAIFTVSDHQSVAVLQKAESLGIRVPQDLGIFGFANETFTAIMNPSLSSVDQKSKELGIRAARVYFDDIRKNNGIPKINEVILETELMTRQSSIRR
ncbi:LacI family DNA-binding transcriptional regulator [Flectobacillus sp. DC10W]|jgi:LacI family transcriptional regulator|uniref:LacI family DNA-binding transcriptional regulator n=1 Tax=Flectobacillus longus TaxID=2984207 RepID=A0ABT6YII1_9BACT|nr:LacI family DNA-binding transcriptional regulator [Flectobacillus longus]MDI9863399.1 LacI family DNA-binding transcriptional regulator [Flectobacillus longus]